MKIGDTVIHKATGTIGRVIVLGLSGSSAFRTEDGSVHNAMDGDLELFFKFNIGDRVVKFKGDYTAAGEVRCAYTTKSGKARYVVEYDALPLQHIHSDKDLMSEADWLERNLTTFGDHSGKERVPR